MMRVQWSSDYCKARKNEYVPNPRSLVLHAPRRVKKTVRVVSETGVEVQSALVYIVAPEDMPLPVGEKALDFVVWLVGFARNEAQC